eukprot:6899140-Prymnesium_polylepis.1
MVAPGGGIGRYAALRCRWQVLVAVCRPGSPTALVRQHKAWRGFNRMWPMAYNDAPGGGN